MDIQLIGDTAIERAEQDLVDPYCGLLSSVDLVRRSMSAPNFFHCMARAGNTRAFSSLSNSSYGGGAATTENRAKQKAMGEAIERYCSALYDPQQLILASAAEIKSEAVNPADFALYSRAQYARKSFPWVPFTSETKIRWFGAEDAMTGRRVFVPACKVFVPYAFYLGDGEAPIDQPISTGLACGDSYASAAVNAICEVIERDHLMLTWQTRAVPPPLDISSLSDQLRNVSARFTEVGYRLSLFDITLDTEVPTIMSILRSPTPGGLFVVAAATSLSPSVAVRKSLEELAHTRHYCEVISELDRQGKFTLTGPSDVVSQVTHLCYYQRHDNQSAADFLFTSKSNRDFRGLRDKSTGDALGDLETLIRAIDNIGQRLYLVEVTTPDVLDLGLHVVRAIIPAAHPLKMGYELRALGGSRLRSTPIAYPHIAVTDDNDNPAPHPFP